VRLLAAAMGTTVTVRTDGEQAKQCADAIADLFEKGFNEELG
jgi:phosphotransferase system HPr-like phosphotransfer protein